jgi:hypothetical protein
MFIMSLARGGHTIPLGVFLFLLCDADFAARQEDRRQNAIAGATNAIAGATV